MANVPQAKVADVFGSVRALPPELQVQAKPIIGSNDLKAITDQHRQVYENAMAYGRMNPDVVLNALKDGGGLANSFGFTSANDILGLTPEEVMALTQGRSVDKSLQNAQTTFDAITGAPENRRAAMHLADTQFGVNSNMLAQQNSQDLAAQQANAGLAGRLAGEQAQLENATNIANAGHATQVQTTQMHIDTQKAIAKEHNDLLRKQMKYMLDSKGSGTTQPPGTYPNPTMVAEYDKQLKQYGILNKKGEFEPSALDPNSAQAKAGWTVYMQRQAAAGLPYNTVYNIPPSIVPAMSGYKQLILGQDGWHGVFQDKQGWQVTSAPIVSFRSVAPPKSASGGSITGMPVYGAGE